MKKALVVHIMLLYMLAISGVMINIHYCGASIQGWELYQKTAGCDDGCDDDSGAEDDGCCKNKTLSAKVSVDHNAATAIKLAFCVIAPLLPEIQIYHFGSPTDLAEGNVWHPAVPPTGPPGLWQGIPLYELYSRLAIDC